MTLIATHAGEREAHLMTDSAAYTPNSGRHIEMTADKLVTLPGMAAATLSAGSYPTSIVWRKVAVALAEKADGFDAWVDQAQDAIKAAVALTESKIERSDLGMVDIYAVGYSPRAGRCQAFVFPCDEDHAPVEITGMHVRPAPPDVEPTEIERRRANVGTSPGSEPADVPGSADEWAALARRVHEGRACAHVETGLKLWVGGDVTLATVTAAGADAQVIHTFTRDDFRRMVMGTWHPLGQVGPCVCGSGRRYVDCHIPKFREVGMPCLCGSGEKFGDCCALDAGEAADLLDGHPELVDLAAVDAPERPAKPAQTGKVGRNDPCPGGCGRKAKRCACAKVPA